MVNLFESDGKAVNVEWAGTSDWQYNGPQFSFKGILYCDTDDGVEANDPETYWTVDAGPSNPYLNATVTFQTKHIKEVRKEQLDWNPTVVLRR